MSGYEIAKWLHVLAAIAWVGGGVFLVVLQLRMRGARDGAALAAMASHSAALGDRYFAPLAVVTLLTGITAALLGDWSFTSPWILVGFVGVATSGVLSGAIGSKTDRAIAERVAADGPDSPALDALWRRHFTLTGLDLAILALVVGAMVAKPGA